MDIPNINLPQKDVSVERGTVFSYPAHTHSHYELTLYEPFVGGITVNGETFPVTSPTVFLISPSDYHKISVTAAPSRYIKISVSDKLLSDTKFKLQKRPTVLFSADEHPLLYGLFKEAAEVSKESEFLAVFAAAAVGYTVRYGTPLEPSQSTKKHELAVSAMRLINDGFKSDISLKSIAKELSVSPQYLSSVFSSQVGIGISSYITDIRLRTAAEALKNSDKNITEICFECGYRNLSHFLRSFKRKYGATPKEYLNKEH